MTIALKTRDYCSYRAISCAGGLSRAPDPDAGVASTGRRQYGRGFQAASAAPTRRFINRGDGNDKDQGGQSGRRTRRRRDDRIIRSFIKNELILPYLAIDLKCCDLGMEKRDASRQCDKTGHNRQ
jgi:hypothetical protein